MYSMVTRCSLIDHVRGVKLLEYIVIAILADISVRRASYKNLPEFLSP